MKITDTKFNVADRIITSWMARNGILLLRISVGIIFFWFGFLKFFPGISPAEDLAAKTIEIITFGIVDGKTGIFLLALWEVLIGIGLLSGIFLRETILLLLLQMVGTIMPVFIFPEEVFTRIPWAPTLEGQYIIKNLVLISAALVIGATVRGGFIVSDKNDIPVIADAMEKGQDAKPKQTIQTKDQL
jgi:uncharacterized membrane protein YphA (DoxX/SURF4 family)